MDHLSADQIAVLRAKLDSEARDLRERIAGDTADIVENISPDPGDIEDAASADAMHFQTKSLLDRDRARLREVEAALARIADGSYGICEDTDEPISFRRLQLEPTTRYTVEALEAREREGGVRDRFDDEPVGY